MLQHQGGRPAFYRSVKVLHKQLFRSGGIVSGKIQKGGFRAFDNPLPPQGRGDTPQGAVPPSPVRAEDSRPAKRFLVAASRHKGALKGNEQIVQEILLAQHKGSRLLAGHLEGHFQIHRGPGVACDRRRVDAVLTEMALQVRHICPSLLGQLLQTLL